MNSKIFFRADAGPEIGYGHFIRTLALADMLRADFDCTFFTQSPTDYQRAEISKVCRLVALSKGDSRHCEFLDMLKGDEIVVLDNYFFTTEYQMRIKSKGCRLVCIDDMHDKHYVADLVINHGQNDYRLFDVEEYTELCLGFEWALLRRPFLKKRDKRSYGPIENIAICFGGSDINDFTRKSIASICANSSVKSISAIVGDSYNSHNIDIDKRVRLYRRLTAEQMATLLSSADLLVSSVSSVCFEALACGTRVAAGWYVENQKEFYDSLCEQNLIYGLGNLNETNFIIDYSKVPVNNDIIIDSSQIQYRYRKLFVKLFKRVFFRPAKSSDVDILYKWANNRKVRENSFNPAQIEYKKHSIWFEKSLASKDILIYIQMYNNQPSGVARLNIDETGCAVISFTVSDQYRGIGLGREIIRLLEIEVCNIEGINRLIAYVKPENVSSRRIFEKQGYCVEFDKIKNVYKYIKIFNNNIGEC